MGFGYYDSEESKSDASIREREIPFCEKELFLVLVFLSNDAYFWCSLFSSWFRKLNVLSFLLILAFSRFPKHKMFNLLSYLYINDLTVNILIINTEKSYRFSNLQMCL